MSKTKLAHEDESAMIRFKIKGQVMHALAYKKDEKIRLEVFTPDGGLELIKKGRNGE